MFYQFMSPPLISAIVFSALFGAALLGMQLRRRLPDHHLCDKTKDAVRIGMGSVATMAALVLGLLVASTKGTYDTEKSELIQLSAKIIWLDRLLINYGPESKECRAILRHAVQASVKRMWPDEGTGLEEAAPTSVWSQELPMTIQKMSPQTEAQRSFKSQAVVTAADLGQMRWLLFEQTESSISTPLLVMMVFWLALTYLSVGLFAPPNGTVVIAQLMAALAVAGALFLILELDQPFSGLVKISSAPMVNALDQLVK